MQKEIRQAHKTCLEKQMLVIDCYDKTCPRGEKNSQGKD